MMGQCTDKMKAELASVADYEDINEKEYAHRILKLMDQVTHGFKDQK